MKTGTCALQQLVLIVHDKHSDQISQTRYVILPPDAQFIVIDITSIIMWHLHCMVGVSNGTFIANNVKRSRSLASLVHFKLNKIN